MVHPTQQASQRIDWSDAEKRKIAEQAYRLIRENPGLSLMTAVDRAQHRALPDNRQRAGLRHQSTDRVKWLKPLMLEIAAKDEKSKEAKAGAEALFLTSPPQQEQEQPEVAANNPKEIQTVVGTALAAAMQKNGVDKLETAPVRNAAGRKIPEKITRWTHDERIQFVRRVDEIRAEDTMLSLTQAARLANAEFPPERQRTGDWAWANVAPWADNLVKIAKSERMAREHKAAQEAEQARAAAAEAEAKAKAERESAEAIEAREREARGARERETAEFIEQQVEARVAAIEARMRSEQVARPMESIIQMFTDRFAEVAVKAFAGSINRAIQDQMMAMRIDAAVPTPRVAPQVEKVIAPPRERLPKVCVVGLIGQQEQDVKRALGDAIEFVFIKSQTQGGSGGNGGAGMLARGGGCDIVVAMSDFIGHDVEFAAKKLSIPYYRVPGSVSALKRWLTEWLAGGYSSDMR